MLRYVVFLLLVVLSFAGCGLFGEPDGAGPSSVTIAHGDSTDLVDAILSARRSLQLALFSFPDRQTVMACNEAANRGLSVQVVLDSDQWTTADGLFDTIGVRYGNTDGDMRANFLIIDGERCLILSSTEIAARKTPIVTIRDDVVTTVLRTEFRQMFDNGRFGGTSLPKKELNAQRIFRVGENTVALHLLPQNDVYQPLITRLGQSGKGTVFTGPYLENPRLKSVLAEVQDWSSGLATWLGSTAPAMMTNCGNILLWPGTTLSTNRIDGTVILCDSGDDSVTAIISTFPFGTEAGLAASDGIVLMVSGQAAQDFDRSHRDRYRGTAPPEPLTIGSFNIENFGATKAGKPEAMAMLVRIATNFDILAVQEFSDASGNVQRQFLGMLNTPVSNYGMLNSGPVGDEQYVFYYRVDRFNLAAPTRIYPDGGGVYTRPPYLAHFRTSDGSVDFVLGNVHTTPGDAAEISTLTDVITDAQTHFSEPDVIIVGDFNADQSYFDPAGYSTLFPPASFIWSIPNGADTTVGSSVKAYDRVLATVSSGEFMTGEWGVYRFDEEHSFRSLTITPDEISDHYPVWIRIRPGQDTD